MLALAAPNATAATREVDLLATVTLGDESGLQMGGPVLSPNGRTLYVAERDTVDGTRQNVRVVDTGTNRTTAVLRVGAQYQSIVDLVLSPDGSRLYALQPGGPNASGQVNVIDTARAAVVAVILPPTTMVSTSNAGAIEHEALSPDGRRLYVSQIGYVTTPGSPDPGSVYVIDTATNTIVDRFGARTWIPDWLTIAPNGRDLYLAAEAGALNGTVIHHFDASVSPPRFVGDVAMAASESVHQLVMNSTGTRLYAIGDYQSSVRVIDTAKDAVVASIAVPGRGYQGVLALSHDDRRLYVANAAPDAYENPTVVVIDTATATVGDTLIGFDLESHLALVVGPGDHTLYLAGPTYTEEGKPLPPAALQVARV
ncbi:YncE family protein [Solihabitans fulvus]|uniref:YncE family protein n=1 Tax=Solihabitans fulvus TaxID=1892852 RepID=A0A5B2XEX6_9PSEU|nr:YncE family protein [Solihabitans fulvus]KAA2261674.1 YncE family protein [Solihabitans fulvus]